MQNISLTVQGMHCKSCKIIVEEILGELGANNIQVDVDEKKKLGKVLCDFPDRKKITDAINKEGYKVV